MLNAQPTPTVPAVPIGMKKAQENVAGSMGSNPGAPGPQVSPPKEEKKESTLKKPEKKLPIKYIISGILLVLLLIGVGAGFYLTQVSQDVRQQASVTAPYCGDGVCQSPGNPCDCLADCGNEPLANQCSGVDTAGPLESCENKECQAGLVCQGQTGSRICQDPGTSDQCPGGGTCTGYTSFVCNNLSIGPETSGAVACNENGQSHGTDQNAAVARANSTGCGQWDQVCVGGTNDGNLCGSFSIINNNCGSGGTGGGGTPNPTTIIQSSPNPSPTPTTTPLAVCNESCSTDADCSQSDHSCIGDVCRLTENPASETCEPLITLGCGDPCTVSTDCTEVNHICLESVDDGNPDGGVCRLIENPTSETCVEPTPEPSPTPTIGCNDACVTSADCSDTDHSCSADTNSCRLTENPGDENCAPATPVPTPAPGCNEECYASTDCSNNSAICYDNLCRLSTNPVDTACQPKDIVQTPEFYEQPELPQALPESGSEDILNWLKVGLGALGLGLIFLFL